MAHPKDTQLGLSMHESSHTEAQKNTSDTHQVCVIVEGVESNPKASV
jgi:hypothetical protein